MAEITLGPDPVPEAGLRMGEGFMLRESRPAWLSNPQLRISNGSFLCNHVTMQFSSLSGGDAANPLESDQSAQKLGSSCAPCVGHTATPG